MKNDQSQACWGLLARFKSPDDLKVAAQALHKYPGVTLDAFCPFPIEGLTDYLHHKPSPLPWIISFGGLLGGVSMYGLQYWISVVAYPLNVGGRPLHSWPSFIPPTFEFTVLMASIFGLVGVFYACGLPRVHHPLFEIEPFRYASTDGFFLSIRGQQVHEDPDRLRSWLDKLSATGIWEVPDV